jgi:hypothetical protein
VTDHPDPLTELARLRAAGLFRDDPGLLERVTKR